MPSNIIYTAEDISAALATLSNIYGRIDDTTHFTYASWSAGGDRKVVKQGAIVPTLFGEKPSLKIFSGRRDISVSTASFSITMPFTNVNFSDQPSVIATVETTVGGFCSTTIRNIKNNQCEVVAYCFNANGALTAPTANSTFTINVIAIGY